MHSVFGLRVVKSSFYRDSYLFESDLISRQSLHLLFLYNTWITNFHKRLLTWL